MLPFKLSDFNRYAVIELPPVEPENAFEEVSSEWTLFCDAWVKLIPAMSSERIAQQIQSANVSPSVVLRFQSGITEEMRIRIEGRTFNITGVSEDRDQDIVTLIVEDKR